MAQSNNKGLPADDMISICELLKFLLINGNIKELYTILKDFKNKIPDGDITYFLDYLLPFGNVLFYRYVKGECREMMNSFHTFDKILHTMKTEDIINVLNFTPLDI